MDPGCRQTSGALQFGSDQADGAVPTATGCDMRITGLDALSRKFQELEKAVAGLDGDIARVSFDPHDPQSIEHAIQDVNSAVDEKIHGYGDNEIVVNIAEALKESYRSAILERAASARLSGQDQE